MKHILCATDTFHQLAVNALLDLCTNQINSESIIKLEGRLVLTVTSGDVFELVISEDSSHTGDTLLDVDSQSQSSLSDQLSVPFGVEKDHSSSSQHLAVSKDTTKSLQSLSFYGYTESQSSSLGYRFDQSTCSAGGKQSEKVGFYMCHACGKTLKSARMMSHHVCGVTPVALDCGLEPAEYLNNTQDLAPASEVNIIIEKAEETSDYVIEREMEPSCRKTSKSRKFGKEKKHVGDSETDYNDGLIACGECDKRFVSRSVQILHRINEHRPHLCTRCNLRFTGRKQFAEHVHCVHPGVPLYRVNKQYVCEYCSAQCADETRLNDHIATRHMGFVHRCEICNKCLGSAETLRIHLRQVHDTTRWRMCEACGRQFSRLAGLMEHLHAAHPNMIPDDYRLKLRDLVCSVCGLTFSRRSTLLRHIETKHTGEPKYNCSLCGRKFLCRRYLLRHQRASHHASVKVEKDAAEVCSSQRVEGVDVKVDLATL